MTYFFFPLFALISKEVQRFFKVLVQTVFTPVITSSLYLFIFGLSLGQSIHMANNISYLAFLVPGLVMMGCLNNAFQNSSSSIVASKFSGDMQDLKVAPISRDQIILAMGVGGVIRGLIVGMITYSVGFIFTWFSQGEILAPAHVGWLATFLVLGALSFAWLGLSVAMWARTFDQLSAVGTFILTPLLYLGGVFFSVKGLPDFWQSLSHFNPLFYMINGVRYGMLGFSDVDPANGLWIVLFFLVFFYLVARWALSVGSFTRW